MKFLLFTFFILICLNNQNYALITFTGRPTDTPLSESSQHFKIPYLPPMVTLFISQYAS